MLFIGTYPVTLNSSCGFRLPKKIARELREKSKERILHFAAADQLRCYPPESIQEYAEEIAGLPDAERRLLRRVTAVSGEVKVSLTGMLPIPDVFCRMYRLAPGMDMMLLGCGHYFELQHTVPAGE